MSCRSRCKCRCRCHKIPAKHSRYAQIIFDVSHEDCSQHVKRVGGGCCGRKALSRKCIFSISVPTGNVFSSQLSLTIGNQVSAGLSNPAIDWDNDVSCSYLWQHLLDMGGDLGWRKKPCQRSVAEVKWQRSGRGGTFKVTHPKIVTWKLILLLTEKDRKKISVCLLPRESIHKVKVGTSTLLVCSSILVNFHCMQMRIE